MPNIYEQFRALLPSSPLVVCQVVVEGPEFCTVQHLGGASSNGVFGFNGVTEVVRGTGPIGTYVFVRGGLIEGPAPDLPVVEIVI